MSLLIDVPGIENIITEQHYTGTVVYSRTFGTVANSCALVRHTY